VADSDEAVREYIDGIDGIDGRHRPLFDRVRAALGPG
jgi:hypothetical protein